MQQTTAEAPSSLNKANNEINSGIPNLIIAKAGDPDHLSQVQIDHLRPKAVP